MSHSPQIRTGLALSVLTGIQLQFFNQLIDALFQEQVLRTEVVTETETENCKQQ